MNELLIYLSKNRSLKSLKSQDSPSGFTVIELLVVIIIIGILSAIVFPSMLSQAAKARQSEAKSYIGTINRAQQAYMVEKLEFADSIERLNILPKQSSQYYSYSFVKTNIQGSVIARPLSEKGGKAYSGATTLFINRAVLKTIICETQFLGAVGLTTPEWNDAESTLLCPNSMEIVAN
ncbi:MAG: type IV pilin-like G/H family protein [Limnothrix sp.]